MLNDFYDVHMQFSHEYTRPNIDVVSFNSFAKELVIDTSHYICTSIVEVSKYAFYGIPIVKFLLFNVVYAHDDVPYGGREFMPGNELLKYEPFVSVYVAFT